MSRFLFLLCVLLATGAFVVAGCGDDDEDSGSAATTEQTEQGGGAATTEGAGGGTEAAGEVKIDMKNIEYIPQAADVKVGQKIVWTNSDSVAHTVTKEADTGPESDTIDPGGTFEYTPTEAGTIPYYCTIHPNQKGTLNVT